MEVEYKVFLLIAKKYIWLKHLINDVYYQINKSTIL